MHFTFIALSPTIDVAFLSYQYKFFACKLSADGKAALRALGEGRKEGFSLQPQHSKAPQRPACRSSSEGQRSGLAGPGANRLLSRREGALQKVGYSLQEADRRVEVRGKGPTFGL